MHKFYDNPAGRKAPAEARVASRLQIGGVAIAPATVLAPMAGITDTVFRRFIREIGGCGLIMTEFTSADGVLRGKDRKAKRYLHFYDDEHPDIGATVRQQSGRRWPRPRARSKGWASTWWT